MKKRTLLSMLLMLAMTLSLVGCGSDDKKPTSTDTAVNGTEATTDVAEKPTEVETPTPEPEKNIITLMSADNKEIVRELNIPNGYTVVSDKKGNHIEIINDNNEFMKIEIYSGLNAQALSEYHQPYDKKRENRSIYRYGTEEERIEKINKISEATGIDVKYFNLPLLDNEYSAANNQLFIFPEQIVLEKNKNGSIKDYIIDISNHSNKETYPISIESYSIEDTEGYLPVNKTWTIKVTSFFNEALYDEKKPYNADKELIEKIEDYARDMMSKKDFIDTMNAFDNVNNQ